MKGNTICLLLVFGIFLLSSCASKTTIETWIETEPTGARIFINGNEAKQTTPLSYTFAFNTEQKYQLLIKKDGYFEEEYTIDKTLPELKEGRISIPLTRSPLWEATRLSPATNKWIQIAVSGDINTRKAWLIMLDTVIKYSSNIKELNYESGYLQTEYTLEKFDTKNGELLLRCQLIVTMVSSDPLIYKLKDVAEWSSNGMQWYRYNRIFPEHSKMIAELQKRLSSQ